MWSIENFKHGLNCNFKNSLKVTKRPAKSSIQ